MRDCSGRARGLPRQGYAKGRLAASPRTGLHKKMKQLVLENDRGKKGVGDSEVQKEIYAFGKELVGSKIVALIGGEGNLPWGRAAALGE